MSREQAGLFSKGSLAEAILRMGFWIVVKIICLYKGIGIPPVPFACVYDTERKIAERKSNSPITKDQGKKVLYCKM